MNISIIGSGNVATVLANLFVAKGGHVIKQIIARNKETGELLAKTLKANYINFKGKIDKNIDLCIVALSDNALPEAIAGLQFGDVLLVHTAGSVSMNELQTNAINFGVLYPLQSLRKEIAITPHIPFLIEANSEVALQKIQAFANSISNDVTLVEEKKRFRLHAAAAIVNNFTNYLYSMAETYCKNEAIDFNLLKPLIIETAERIKLYSPMEVQTGPAVRRDITTLEKHLQLFSHYPKMKTLYTRMTDGIMNG